jgi:hypothetical protein
MNNRKTQGFGAAMLGGMALSGLLATAFLCGTAASARADAGNGDTLDLSDLERVTDDSLGVLRGGFRVGNVDLSFGVTMSTSVNGQQVLQTVFNPGDGPISNSVTTPDLKTTINHDIGQSISTDIANSADNRMIQNTTTVNVFLNNLSQVQAQASQARMTSNMVGDLNNQFTVGN